MKQKYKNVIYLWIIITAKFYWALLIPVTFRPIWATTYIFDTLGCIFLWLAHMCEDMHCKEEKHIHIKKYGLKLSLGSQ